MTQIETPTGDISGQLSRSVEEVEAAIERFMAADEAIPEELFEAVMYSLRAGGKRLRPAMVVLACEACEGQLADALPAAAAMEMVHTFSLIHDDLPAMDDDDLRRGKPTNHKVFGEAMAILAGDALVTCAFGVLGRHVADAEISRQLVIELAAGSGASGMIGGQVLDMLGEQREANLEMVRDIHAYKTAMMFRASLRMGAVSGGANAERVTMLGDYGLKVGLAFQIVDDLLDITSTPEDLGKQTQKDQEAGKLTYPGVAGVAEAKAQVDRLIAEALAALDGLGEAGRWLRELATMLAKRKN